MFLFGFFSLGSYVVIVAGWRASRVYRILGRVRVVAQMISYEVVFIVVVLLLFLYRGADSFTYSRLFFCDYLRIVFIYPVIMYIWVFRLIAETNRTPFDFAEGESELVSGFNTEFGGRLFALFFIREYGRILFLSFLRAYFLVDRGAAVIFVSGLVSFFWVWVRATFPRYRYDLFMASC